MTILKTALLATVLACSSMARSAPAVNVDAQDTVRIYMTGSAALRGVVAGLVLDDICGGSAANSTTTLYNLAESGSDLSFNGNFWAISCRVTAAGGALVGLPVSTPVAFFKSDAGGSAQGVFPLFFGNQRPFVEPANLGACTTAIADRAYTTCPATRLARPMVGLSDMEPALFKDGNMPADPLDADDDAYPYGGLSEQQLSELIWSPMPQLIYGVAVNTALYHDMFVTQQLSARKDLAGNTCTMASTDELCVPRIAAPAARTLLSGTETNWRLLSGNTAKLDSQVNICRYVNGHGAQAAANAHLMRTPCGSAGISVAGVEYSTSALPDLMSASRGRTQDGRSIAQYLVDNMGGGAGTGPMPSGTTFVFEGPDTADVISCLNAAERAGGYAIAHPSLVDLPAGAGGWRLLRLAGVLPSREAVKQGRYDYAFESTLQWKADYLASLSSQQQSFITRFAAHLRKPDALMKLNATSQNGVAAQPSSYAGDFGTGSASEIAFGSRVTRGGGNCRPMTAYK